MRPTLNAAAMIAMLTVGQLLATGATCAEDRVYPTAEQVSPLGPGDPVPSASVSTVRGGAVDLAEQVRENGAMLVFYRGGW